jgi:hypothetical protein
MNRKDILTTIVFIILIAIVGGLFAYEYWWQPKKAKELELPKTTEEKKEITKEEKEESISPKSEIEWQEFKVEKYGFSMKIPADYKKTYFEELKPEESKTLLGTGFAKNDSENFALFINNEGEKGATEAKETYQLEFERQEDLKRADIFPKAKLISVQKLEKKECSIFIFSLEKDNGTFYKLVFVFPTYRKELVFNMNFNYPSKDEEEKVWEMINSIECSSPR